MMRNLPRSCTMLVAAALLMGQAPAQQVKKVYDVPGPIELHIYLTVKAGQEKELERVYREEFYAAVSRQRGFISSEMVHKPDSRQYVVRHTFQTEELRLKWVATPEHERIFPKLTALCTETTWQGFGVVFPLK